MTVFDYAALGIIGLSVLVSAMRGAVREVLALGAWVLSFWVAKLYTGMIIPFLPAELADESLRYLAGFLMLFLACLLVMSLVAIGVSELVKRVGLGLLDRGLGAVFGTARGILIVAVLVLLAGFTSLPQQPAWRNAMFSPPFEALVLQLKGWLPEDLSRRIRYD